MFWLLPLAGAAAGALMNKKDPWKGALLGAGVGATGGMLAPAAAGAGAAGAGGLFGSAAGGAASTVAADAIGAGMGSIAEQAAMQQAMGQGGLFGNLKTFGAAVKPFGDAASAANSAQGLFADRSQPVQHAQMPPMMGGNQVLAQLAAMGPQEQQAQMQAEMQRRQRRAGLLGVA